MEKRITSFKDYLSGLEAFPIEKYKKMDLDRLAVYTLSILQENDIPLYFDYVVVALFKLFPQKFSLVNFEEYPDADRVEKVLLHLKPRDRNWATGTVKGGYVLTETGIEVAKQTRELLKHPEMQKSPKLSHIVRTASPENEIEEVRRSELYEKWSAKSKNKIGEYDIWAFLHAVPYTPKSLLRKYLRELKQSAGEINDREILKFLKWIENEYVDLFKDKVNE